MFFLHTMTFDKLMSYHVAIRIANDLGRLYKAYHVVGGIK